MTRRRYRYLLVDSRPSGTAGVGNVVAEIPLSNVNFSSLLTNVGSLSASMPVNHPKALRTLNNFRLAQRDLTVVREGQVVWNGPLTSVKRNSKTKTLELTAHEFPWYLSRRTIETNKDYNIDVLAVVRDLITTVRAKTNGEFYRLNVSSATAGVTKKWKFSGAYRREVLQIINDLAAETFDYRMLYTGSVGDAATRFLDLGAPTLGVLRGYVLEPKSGLVDVTIEEDLSDSCNRAHVIGSNGLVHTSTNAASYAADDVLLERVFDRGDVSSPGVIQAYARDRAANLKPPIVVYSAIWTPRKSLPYGFALPGDTVPLVHPGLGIPKTNLRIVGVETEVGPPERVTFIFAEPTT